MPDRSRCDSGTLFGKSDSKKRYGSGRPNTGAKFCGSCGETQARIVSEFGVKVRYSPADMSKAESISDMIAMALETFGRLDILVNNAGIQHVAPLEQFPVAKWDNLGHQSLVGIPHNARGTSVHAQKEVRPYH